MICGHTGHTASSCTDPRARIGQKIGPKKPPPPPDPEPDELTEACLKMVAGWVRNEKILNDGFAEMCRALEERDPQRYWKHFRAGSNPRQHCLIPECQGGHYAKGYCNQHYRQWRNGRLR